MSSRRFTSLCAPEILGIKPYKPGKTIEELARERNIARIVKLASNENPLGSSPGASKALVAQSDNLHRYPDGGGFELKSALARKFSVSIDQLALGNGSSEIIEMMVRLFVRPGKKVVLASPSFSIYSITVEAQGGEVVNVPLRNHAIDLEGVSKAVDADTSLIILGTPNNPTGKIFERKEWEAFLERTPLSVAILLDEAYAEYVDAELLVEGCKYLSEERPLVAARTFSKAYGIAALRIGYAIAPAEIIDYMDRLRLPFNANGAAQAAALAAVEDDEHLSRCIEANRQGRDRLESFFAASGVEYIPSQANFVLARVGDGDAFFEAMLDEGVIIRSATGFGMAEWIRVSIGTAEEMVAFEEAFTKVREKVGK
jgi:histidinol-phosphate aminotransferase